MNGASYRMSSSRTPLRSLEEPPSIVVFVHLCLRHSQSLRTAIPLDVPTDEFFAEYDSPYLAEVCLFWEKYLC